MKDLLKLVFIVLPFCALADTSVTHNGVTWNWTENLTVGTYAKGEPYVVVPSTITITSVTPAWDGSLNGIMVNPAPNSSQGYDTRVTNLGYSAAANIADNLPYSGSAGQSLVKAISLSSVAGGNKKNIARMGILTLVASAPAANSFRPPYTGTNKTSEFTTADLNYSALNNLSAANLVDVPNQAAAEVLMDFNWVEHNTGWQGLELRPSSDMPEYGRELAYRTERAALWLQLTNTDAVKETTLINIVQYAIDLEAFIAAGADWEPDGGHNVGRRVAMAVGAAVLGDAEMLGYLDAADNNFHEEGATFYVEQIDVDTLNEGVKNNIVGQYVSGDIGLEEWGFRHSVNRINDNALWGVSYRTTAGSTFIGSALAMRLMGLVDDADDSGIADSLEDAFFAYADRYFSIEEINRSNAANDIHTFPASFWDEHRYASPPNPSTKIDAATLLPVGGSYDSTQSATLTEAANTTSYYTTDGSTPDNTDTEYTAPVSISSSQTFKWITYDDTATLDPSLVESATYTISCAIPVVSPNGGIFQEAQSVTLSTATAGAAIYYTTDGSEPDATDTLYSGAFEISSTTILKSVAIKAGLDNSVVSEIYFALNRYVTEEEWQNVSIDAEAGSFSYDWFATPASLSIDAVFAFSDGAISNPVVSADFDAMAVSIRFADNDVINARNGGSYAAESVLSYTAGTQYHFKLEIDISSHTYSAWVTPDGGSGVLIADGYSFRTEQASVTNLDNFAFIHVEKQLAGGDYATIDGLYNSVATINRSSGSLGNLLGQ